MQAPGRGFAGCILTFTSVIERMPSGSSLATTFTRRSPSACRYLCSGTSITFLLAGQAPTTSAR